MPAVNGVGGAVCGRTACTVRRAGVGNGVIGQGHRSGTTRWGNPGHQGFGTYHQMITTAPAPDPTRIGGKCDTHPFIRPTRRPMGRPVQGRPVPSDLILVARPSGRTERVPRRPLLES